MKGIIAAQQQAALEITDDLERPQPSEHQILVKSIYTAINPVDHMMVNMGILVEDWPLVPGCDAAGVVVEVGAQADSIFAVGDEVCGCTRLGMRGYSTCQEYFLMDAHLAIPKPANLSLAEAATIGVGVETAALGIFPGCNIPLPDPDNLPAAKNEWAVVLGGASTVGRYGIQLLKLSGYNVIASCSESSAESVRATGADAVFDYKTSTKEQIDRVLAVLTESKSHLHCVFDAAATGDALARTLFAALPAAHRYFATTNDWSGITDFEGATAYCVRLGLLGRDGAADISDAVAGYIPVLARLFASGRLVPGPYVEVGDGGLGAVLEALEYQRAGAGSRKVVVRVQES